MRISSRFSIGVHILTLLAFAGEGEATSEWMAGSIGVNAVVVRNVTGQLRRAGLVSTSQGVAGTRLAKPLESITLLDVFRAVEEEGDLFSVHPKPNPDCPVGAHIQYALEVPFAAAQAALLAQLASTTVADIVRDVETRVAG